MKKILILLLIILCLVPLFAAKKDKNEKQPQPQQAAVQPTEVVPLKLGGLTADELLLRSDKLYYSPALTVASCELRVPFIQDDKSINTDGNLKFYYKYNTKLREHTITIEGLNEDKQTLKNSILNILEPIVESSFPVKPSTIIESRKVDIIAIQKRVVGNRVTTLYKVVAQAPIDANGNKIGVDIFLLMTFGGLVDKYDIQLNEAGYFSYAIKNLKTDYGYLMSNMVVQSGSRWQDEEITYVEVGPYFLPGKFVRKTINMYGKEDPTVEPLVVYFNDWIATK